VGISPLKNSRKEKLKNNLRTEGDPVSDFNGDRERNCRQQAKCHG
jgi:hypothetical protein